MALGDTYWTEQLDTPGDAGVCTSVHALPAGKLPPFLVVNFTTPIGVTTGGGEESATCAVHVFELTTES